LPSGLTLTKQDQERVSDALTTLVTS